VRVDRRDEARARSAAQRASGGRIRSRDKRDPSVFRAIAVNDEEVLQRRRATGASSGLERRVERARSSFSSAGGRSRRCHCWRRAALPCGLGGRER
jgi:hypothetical protein